MIFDNWRTVIVSWINALDLTKEPINEISDLLKGEFFFNIFTVLDKDTNGFDKEGEGFYKLIEHFFKEEFEGFRLNERPWDKKELTLITSVVLLYGSLRSQKLRVPLYSLTCVTQMVIQAFIQKFLSMEVSLINHDLVYQAINDIPNDDEDFVADPELSFVSNPGFKLSPVAETSPDLKRHNHAKLKSIQCKLDLVEWEKQHLQEEMDSLKNDFDDLQRRYDIREHKFMKLESELFICKGGMEREENEVVDRGRMLNINARGEEKRLKIQLEEMERAMETMRTDLYRTLTRVSTLESELERSDENRDDAEQRCLEAEARVALLTANMEDLEAVIASLKQTCKEQKELLDERASTSFTEDSMIIVGDTETLASVVDKKYSEIEEELLVVKDELKSTQQDKENLLRQVEELKTRVNEREIEDREELARVNAELSSKTLALNKLREDNDSVLSSFEDKKVEAAKLRKELDRLKRNENLLSEETCGLKNRLDSELQISEYWKQEGSLRNDKLFNEISHLNSLLDSKQLILDETTILVSKLKRDLSDREHEIIVLKDELTILNKKLTNSEVKVNDMKKETLDFNIEREQFTDNLNQYKNDYSMLKKKLFNTELELENVRGDLRVRGTTVLALEQNVKMCEHEKAILQRKIEQIQIEADRFESLKLEVSKLKMENSRVAELLNAEKLEVKRLTSQIDVDEKLNNAFDYKLADLQTKMKTQHDNELMKTVEEYTCKINQFKKKMLRDKSHIEELSADLWETSDRYLLASQESNALRNELNRTRTALELLSRNNAQIASGQRSNPCLLFDNDEDFDDKLMMTRERWGRRFSCTSSTSGLFGDPLVFVDRDNEVFNDACLEDLKTGVCRLPPGHEFYSPRASCPIPKTPDASVEKSGDRQSLLPQDKPKKIKAHISYSRPGPPTPSRNRLSLQNIPLMEPNYIKERVQIVMARETHGQTRLSRLFSRGQGKSVKPPVQPTVLQVSPKVKRKSFFQRKFGTNRENIPPPT